MQIAIVGLGKLGLCTAACFAAHGHKVVGVERDRAVVAALAERRCPIAEPGLPELLAAAWPNLSVTTEMTEAVAASDAALIIVPTPSQPDGRFDNQYVLAALRQMAPAIRKKNAFYVIDVVSTVMPGSCETVFRPLLEQEIGGVCGQDFGLIYNPEFIAIGSVIRNFLHPDLVLIGESDSRSGAFMEELYRTTCESTPQISRMTLVNAEVTKLALNCYVTMKISFANELASLCERIPGADVDRVAGALGADSRVGRKYLTGGLGFGGPCFPRDNQAFQACGREFGYDVRLSPGVVEINRNVVKRLTEEVLRGVERSRPVAILGLPYKTDTHLLDESQSMQLAEMLLKVGYPVRLHDPVALPQAQKALGERAEYFTDSYECARGAGAVVLMTRWPEYETLDWSRLAGAAAADALLLDAWRIVPPGAAAGMRHTALGRYAEGRGRP